MVLVAEQWNYSAVAMARRVEAVSEPERENLFSSRSQIGKFIRRSFW